MTVVDRVQAVESMIHECYRKYKHEALLSMPFNVEDRGSNVPGHSYSMAYDKRRSKELREFCGPDWSFHSWKSCNIQSFWKTVDDIIEASKSEPTIDKVGWYGNIYSPLPDVQEAHTRPLLYEIGQRIPAFFDIVHILHNQGVIDARIKEYISLPELVKRYKYVIDIGGNGFSGRLKYLLYSRRPILLVDRNYVDFFYEDLIPYTHFVPVKEDLSDIMKQTMWMRSNPEKCQEIAENAYQYAKENFTQDRLMERIYHVGRNLGMLTHVQ